MNRKRLIIPAVVVLAAAGFWLYRRSAGDEAPAYRYATVERGDLEATVSATGALGAVTTVQVGTQVSGQVSAIYVDFNDRVKKGQLIARIDPTLQQQTVRDAQAGLERAQAEVAKAQQDYDRNRQLYERKVLTESEFNAAQYALSVARANLKSAQVTLDRGRQNLSYTSIYAPIDGVVVERNVDVGQTVAASLSAPQLFLIANDLARMQILASVDESDIGLIEEGQPARFTVQAYPNERFTGTVQQVRLQSTTTENVVNYTAVVEVANPEGKLLPGMTATVDFLTGEADDVLMVPNAALRFRATEAMLAEVGQQPGASQQGASRRPASGNAAGGARVTATAGGTVAGGTVATGSGASGAAAAARAANATTLWYVDPAGKLGTVRVRTGLSDGQRTEVRGDGLTEGMRIIVGVTQGGDAAGAAASPFQTQTRTGPPRPGGF
jgi:HlyD family secretion protein